MLSLEKLLKNTAGNGLEKIVQRAQNMDDIAQKLRQAIDKDVAEQISAINVRNDGDLVVVCTTSAWAARIRFDGEALVAAARRLGADVTRCHVRVASP